MRLFAALVPPPAALDHAERALEAVRSSPAGLLRWVPRENLHVTLAFYGETPDGALGDLTEGLAALASTTAAPELSLAGAGAFAGRTLWLGVAGEVRGAQALMGGAADLADRHEETGPPRPHVTVARAGRRGRGVDLSDVVRALSVYRGPMWRAPAITLLSSRLGAGPSGAPRYEVEAELPFA